LQTALLLEEFEKSAMHFMQFKLCLQSII
jgi:hypothetical protein